MRKKQRRRRQFDPERLNTLVYFDAEATIRYAPISKRTYYQAIAEGKLPAFRVGGTGKLVVRKEALDRFLSAAPVESELDRIVDEVMEEVADASRSNSRT